MMELENPAYGWLWLWIPVLALLYGAYRVWYYRTIRKLGSPVWVRKLLPDTRRRHTWRMGILAGAAACITVALLNPRFPETVTAADVPVAEVVFLVDVSTSMLTADVPPYRLAKARQILTQLFTTLDKSRVGVGLYAARAYPLLPLTDDMPVAASFVPAIQPSAIRQQGTRVGGALELAALYFDDTTRHNRVVFLLSDGENHDQTFLQAAQNATRKGIVIHTIGIGTPEGGPIPVTFANGSVRFKTDAAGHVVQSRLEADNLRRIAEAAHGSYLYVTSTPQAVQFVQQRIEEARLAAGSPPRIMGYRSLYPWFVGLALVLLTLEMGLAVRKLVKPSRHL